MPTTIKSFTPEDVDCYAPHMKAIRRAMRRSEAAGERAALRALMAVASETHADAYSAGIEDGLMGLRAGIKHLAADAAVLQQFRPQPDALKVQTQRSRGKNCK
jgi:hypothetical protein